MLYRSKIKIGSKYWNDNTIRDINIENKERNSMFIWSNDSSVNLSQIKFAIANKIDNIFTDTLPNELNLIINKEDFNFFNKSFIFKPPDAINISNGGDKKILIYNDNLQEENTLKILSKIKFLKIIDIDNLKNINTFKERFLLLKVKNINEENFLLKSLTLSKINYILLCPVLGSPLRYLIQDINVLSKVSDLKFINLREFANYLFDYFEINKKQRSPYKLEKQSLLEVINNYKSLDCPYFQEIQLYQKYFNIFEIIFYKMYRDVFDSNDEFFRNLLSQTRKLIVDGLLNDQIEKNSIWYKIINYLIEIDKDFITELKYSFEIIVSKYNDRYNVLKSITYLDIAGYLIAKNKDSCKKSLLTEFYNYLKEIIVIQTKNLNVNQNILFPLRISDLNLISSKDICLFTKENLELFKKNRNLAERLLTLIVLHNKQQTAKEVFDILTQSESETNQIKRMCNCVIIGIFEKNNSSLNEVLFDIDSSVNIDEDLMVFYTLFSNIIYKYSSIYTVSILLKLNRNLNTLNRFKLNNNEKIALQMSLWYRGILKERCIFENLEFELLDNKHDQLSYITLCFLVNHECDNEILNKFNIMHTNKLDESHEIMNEIKFSFNYCIIFYYLGLNKISNGYYELLIKNHPIWLYNKINKLIKPNEYY